MPTKELPDPEYLRQRLRYEPETGKLYWRERPDMPTGWNTRWAGREAGHQTTRGYATLRIAGAAHYAHRIAWAMATNYWPSRGLDHVNGNLLDNRLENLREATQTTNLRNAGINARNSSGYTGVSWDKRRHKWQAYITVSYIKKSLGFFDNISEAVAIRKAAEKQYDFHPNHGRAAPV